jgi:hypothetical protein
LIAYELNKLEDIAIYMKSQHGNTIPPTNKTVALRTCFIMDFENGV